jgi:hypothetical protein
MAHNSIMQRAFRHLLVYACSVQLLLPGGWCCAAIGALSPSAAESANPPAKACCCCCPKQQAPSHQKAPMPEPPKEPVRPCCIEKAALLVSLHHDDLQVADLPALPIETAAVGTQVSVESASVLPPAHPTLHLRNCVWLC